MDPLTTPRLEGELPAAVACAEALDPWTSDDVERRVAERVAPRLLARFAEAVRTLAAAGARSGRAELLTAARAVLGASPAARLALCADPALARWTGAAEAPGAADGAAGTRLLSLAPRFTVAVALLDRGDATVRIALGPRGRARIPADGRILEGPPSTSVPVAVRGGALHAAASPPLAAGPFRVVLGDEEEGRMPRFQPLTGRAGATSATAIAAGVDVLAGIFHRPEATSADRRAPSGPSTDCRPRRASGTPAGPNRPRDPNSLAAPRSRPQPGETCGLAATAHAALAEAAALAPVLYPIAAEPGVSRSASIPDVRAAIWLSPCDRPLVLAETLVHEASHLKYYLAEDAFPFAHAPDSPRYAVPWRPDPRPIRTVLMGLHAWVRVMEWLRTLDGTPWAQPARERLALLRDGTGAAGDIIARAEGLTDAGHALGAALIERLGG